MAVGGSGQGEEGGFVGTILDIALRVFASRQGQLEDLGGFMVPAGELGAGRAAEGRTFVVPVGQVGLPDSLVVRIDGSDTDNGAGEECFEDNNEAVLELGGLCP